MAQFARALRLIYDLHGFRKLIRALASALSQVTLPLARSLRPLPHMLIVISLDHFHFGQHIADRPGIDINLHIMPIKKGYYNMADNNFNPLLVCINLDTN